MNPVNFNEPHIELVSEKKLVGKFMRTNFLENRAPELWKSFMPVRNQVSNGVGGELYSVQVYDIIPEFQNFKPEISFERWAARQVTDFDNGYSGFSKLVIPEGLYAVFHYCGTPLEFPEMVKFIFLSWLPGSGYVLDHRPHFEVLGEKYKRDSPDSEEDIFIPVRKK